AQHQRAGIRTPARLCPATCSLPRAERPRLVRIALAGIGIHAVPARVHLAEPEAAEPGPRSAGSLVRGRGLLRGPLGRDAILVMLADQRARMGVATLAATARVAQ